IAALHQALDSAAGDPEAHVVVLAAAGKGFCAGHDLKEMRAHSSDPAWEGRPLQDLRRLVLSLANRAPPPLPRAPRVAERDGRWAAGSLVRGVRRACRPPPRSLCRVPTWGSSPPRPRSAPRAASRGSA